MTNPEPPATYELGRTAAPNRPDATGLVMVIPIAAGAAPELWPFQDFVAQFPYWSGSVDYQQDTIVWHFGYLWIRNSNVPTDHTEPQLGNGVWSRLGWQYGETLTMSASVPPSPEDVVPGTDATSDLRSWVHYLREGAVAPANLHTAYFPSNSQVYDLPDAAGEYEVAILDPVSIALALVDGDSFIVHAVLSGLPEGATAELQIRGRQDDTVRTDSVAFSGHFTTLTLDTPGDAEDTAWTLYVRGTKPATTDASIGVNLREVIGVKGATPFSRSVAQMLEDYMATRLAYYYGVTFHQVGTVYVAGQVVIDLTDGNLYRFTPGVGHSTGSPSGNAAQWERLTWPQPANWALETRDPDGLQKVPLERLDFRLPPAYEAAVTYANTAEVLHADAVWRNVSGGPLTGVEPEVVAQGQTEQWRRIANFGGGAEAAAWAREGNTELAPASKVDIQISFQRTITPDQPNTLVMSWRGGTIGAIPVATEEFPGLMTPEQFVKLLHVERFATRGITPRGAWASGTVYELGDQVFRYITGVGTISAECLQAHTAAFTNAPAPAASAFWQPLEVDYQSNWTAEGTQAAILNKPVVPDFRGRWQNGETYAAGALVQHQPAGTVFDGLWWCTSDHAADADNAPPGGNWQLVWQREPIDWNADPAIDSEGIRNKPTIPAVPRLIGDRTWPSSVGTDGQWTAPSEASGTGVAQPLDIPDGVTQIAVVANEGGGVTHDGPLLWSPRSQLATGRAIGSTIAAPTKVAYALWGAGDSIVIRAAEWGLDDQSRLLWRKEARTSALHVRVWAI